MTGHLLPHGYFSLTCFPLTCSPKIQNGGNNLETGLITFPDIIHFMPLKGGVEVDMTVDIDKINGNCIGISTFTDN